TCALPISEVDLSLGWSAGRAAHAMMDLSDGLVRDGGRLAAASRVRIDLDRAALAPDVETLAALAEELGEDPWAWVLHGAEEHAMLAADRQSTRLNSSHVKIS